MNILGLISQLIGIKTLKLTLSLSISLLYFSLSLDLGFPHGIKALKTLTSVFRSFPFCLPHLFHKYIHKASHPKSCSFRKLITKISPLHQNRQNPYYPIRIQVCTRSHARPIASKILRSLHALPYHQVLVLPLLATDSSGHHFHSIDWRPIYPNPSCYPNINLRGGVI